MAGPRKPSPFIKGRKPRARERILAWIDRQVGPEVARLNANDWFAEAERLRKANYGQLLMSFKDGKLDTERADPRLRMIVWIEMQHQLDQIVRQLKVFRDDNEALFAKRNSESILRTLRTEVLPRYPFLHHIAQMIEKNNIPTEDSKVASPERLTLRHMFLVHPKGKETYAVAYLAWAFGRHPRIIRDDLAAHSRVGERLIEGNERPEDWFYDLAWTFEDAASLSLEERTTLFSGGPFLLRTTSAGSGELEGCSDVDRFAM